jgi:hypothetical protein
MAAFFLAEMTGIQLRDSISRLDWPSLLLLVRVDLQIEVRLFAIVELA